MFETMIYLFCVRPAYRRAVYQTYNLYWKKGRNNEMVENEK